MKISLNEGAFLGLLAVAIGSCTVLKDRSDASKIRACRDSCYPSKMSYFLIDKKNDREVSCQCHVEKPQ